MNAKQQFGVLSIVLAVLLGVWAVNRVTSIIGQLHSWAPPFDKFEVYTIVGGLLALLFLLTGLRMAAGRKKID